MSSQTKNGAGKILSAGKKLKDKTFKNVFYPFRSPECSRACSGDEMLRLVESLIRTAM